MANDKEIKIEMAVPNFEKLMELKKLGFDLSDIQKTNEAYVTACQDENKMIKLTNIILKNHLTPKELKTVPFSEIRIAFKDFLAECGLLIL